MAKKLVLPRLHVMVLCDDIQPSLVEDEVYDLIGVRTSIVVAVFPYSHPLLGVYLQLTGHPGSTRCRVIIVNAEIDEAVLSAEPQRVVFTGPLDFVPAIFRLEDCDFAGPGLYYVQVYCDQKLVG